MDVIEELKALAVKACEQGMIDMRDCARVTTFLDRLRERSIPVSVTNAGMNVLSRNGIEDHPAGLSSLADLTFVAMLTAAQEGL